MNYLAASCRGINLEILFIDDASIGVPACAGRLISFIPIRCAIGIPACTAVRQAGVHLTDFNSLRF